MLEPLFYPKTVAVIGASNTAGKVGYAIMANLAHGGYQGKVVPINPKAPEVFGHTCYPDIRSYNGQVDLTVICVPTKAVLEAVENASKAGTRAIIVISAGFKEVGEEGARLEEEIVKICRRRRIRMLGPNCLGLINTDNNLNASFASRMPHKGNISVVSQSGALCTAILDAASERRLGLAKLISIGNKADLNENDFLMALAQDDKTKVIVGYLESVTMGDAFIKIAERTAGQKPLVLLKAGTTDAGVKAASSHTGSLAGGSIAYGAAFKRAGVVRANTFEELFDYATALSMQPLPMGNRVAIITNAGGPGILAADAAESSGLVVTSLGRRTTDMLREKLPTAASVYNPIDVLGDADPERYVFALNVAQDDDQIDAIVIILTPQAMTRPAEIARALAEQSRGVKPVLVSFMGGTDVMPGRDELVAHNLPDYPSPERAVAALKAMVDYSAWLHRPPRVVARYPVNRRRVERIIARHLRVGQLQLSEAHAKDILLAYGFQVPTGHLAHTDEEAVEVAARLGYPVVMKIVSPDIIHKSDVGGVRLNLAHSQAVRDAYDLMMLRIRRRRPGARVEGVYIEQQASAGREVILGMTRDPQFGPMLMFGLGGIFVEALKDVSFYLAPITSEEALQMLRSTRSYALLEGLRGQTAVDLESIAVCLQRLSQLVTDFPQIKELDINPLIVGELGSEPIVADARMSLSAVESAS
ncbi:MAG: acetate--CoA ligase family protein [Bradymonadales bacterium]|nr:acetate--CoA ligase family protein [Bradymonadales bacterium]